MDSSLSNYTLTQYYDGRSTAIQVGSEFVLKLQKHHELMNEWKRQMKQMIIVISTHSSYSIA